MSYPHPIIAREGWPFVAGSFAAAIIINVWAGFWWALPLWVIALSWFLAGALTFLTEAIAFSITYNVPMLRVLEIDFNFQAGVRPGWYVWGVGAIVILIGLIRLKPASRLQLASGQAAE